MLRFCIQNSLSRFRSASLLHCPGTFCYNMRMLCTSSGVFRKNSDDPSLSWMKTGKVYHYGPDQILPSTAIRSWHRHGAVRIDMKEEKTGAAKLEPVSVPSFLLACAAVAPHRLAMIVEREGRSDEWSFRQYLTDVRTCGKGFISLGLEPYHSVCILAANSPEWFISALGAIFAGGLAAGIYTTNTPEMCAYCAKDSEANIYVVDDEMQLDKILKVRDQLPHLKAIVLLNGESKAKGVITWKELMRRGAQETDLLLNDRLSKVAINQCCSLIYTSGTTGNPKGVMLTHDNVTWMSMISRQWAGFQPLSEQGFQEIIVSFLPLSHVAAQMADMFCPLSCCGCVIFASKDALKGTLVENLKNYQPTKFLAVPRVWETIYAKMVEAGRNSDLTGWRKDLFEWARKEAYDMNIRKMNGKRFAGTLKSGFANGFVLDKVRKALGLQRCNLFLSGAAPLSHKIIQFFITMNIPVTETYGMSETSGPHAMGVPDPGMFRFKSVGKTIFGCETKIANPGPDGQGEILMRGRHITMGYLHLPEVTMAAIDDEGWLHSEDVGYVDSDGFLFVTGRLKEILITAGGENVAPIPIEERIAYEIPAVSQAVVIGDKLKFLSALLTLKTEVNPNTQEPTDILLPISRDWIENHGSCSVKTIQDVLKELNEKNNTQLRKAFDAGISRVNEKAVSQVARVRKWVVLPKDFSMSGGEIGPTLKLKRKVVYQKYADLIEKIYKET